MDLSISVIYSLILACIGLYKKSFTILGIISAFIITTIINYCGGYPALVAIMSLFIITIITDKIGKNKKEKIEKEKHKDTNKRSATQVLANLLIASVLMIAYKITENTIYNTCFFISIAVSAADTSASGVGLLSEKSFNILTFKKSDRGLSGNISLLGLLASLIAAVIIGGIDYFFTKSPTALIIITLLGFGGALIDSILGCFQVKYKCSQCGFVTERIYHCNKKTNYHKGIRLLNNSAVNFISNMITCSIFLIITIYL